MCVCVLSDVQLGSRVCARYRRSSAVNPFFKPLWKKGLFERLWQDLTLNPGCPSHIPVSMWTLKMDYHLASVQISTRVQKVILSKLYTLDLLWFTLWVTDRLPVWCLFLKGTNDDVVLSVNMCILPPSKSMFSTSNPEKNDLWMWGKSVRFNSHLTPLAKSSLIFTDSCNTFLRTCNGFQHDLTVSGATVFTLIFTG